RGDATRPIAQGNKLIVHICNDRAHWGGGFTEAISHRWFRPQIALSNLHMRNDTDVPLELGLVQKVKVTEDIWVVNLIGQKGTRTVAAVPPIRYGAVGKGLRRVARMAHDLEASVHMPRIGTGLAGGTWNRIEPIIQEHLCNQGIHVTVYDPEPNVNYYADY
ncbi:MAG: hypothetical protein ACRCZI_04845, partial [Cetobacterium sp.]